MVLNINEIIEKKLKQLADDRVIESAIEATLEKTIRGAVVDALTDYQLRRDIEKQLSESVSNLAAQCGLSSYNGFIARKAAEIVREQMDADLAEKVETALRDAFATRYENVKLSEIFDRYREWVCTYTEDADKYERQTFTCELDVKTRNRDFTWITCDFSDRPMGTDLYRNQPDIRLKFCVYRSGVEEINSKNQPIDFLYFDGHNMKDCAAFGQMNDFERFVLNLYFNKTPVLLDLDDVDDSNEFDIDS